MSHSGESSHPPEHVAAGAPHGAPGQPLFSPEVFKSLRDADKLAAGWVVGLMGGIFSVGVVLYIIVMWSVFDAPQWWSPLP